jgi:hypothetical protein
MPPITVFVPLKNGVDFGQNSTRVVAGEMPASINGPVTVAALADKTNKARIKGRIDFIVVITQQPLSVNRTHAHGI